MNKKTLALGIVLLLTLLVTGCVTQTQEHNITVTKEDNTYYANYNTAQGPLPLIDLLTPAQLKNPQDYIYIISSPTQEGQISYEELKDGTLIPATQSLSFTNIMCECANIAPVTKLTIQEKQQIVRDEHTFIVKGELKSYIKEYLTPTPEAYLYVVNEETITYDTLPADAQNIEMKTPEEALIMQIKGHDNQAVFREGSVKDNYEILIGNPQDYIYVVDETVQSYEQVKAISKGSILVMRNYITITNNGEKTQLELSLEEDTPFVSIATCETCEYKLMTADGFTPPPLSFNDFKDGYWNVQKQQSEFPTVNSKKYQLRDLASITIQEVTAPLTQEMELDMQTLQEDLQTTSYEGQEALLLADFVSVTNPDRYIYRIVASDGYSPKPFTWEDMQNGYWLLSIDETLFPDKNFGSNRIREPTTIIILVEE